MNLKKITALFVLLSLSSCVPIMRSLIGNKIMDHNYGSLPQSSPFYVAIPYKIEDGFITLKARMNNTGKEYNFIFDTGATITIVSDSVAKELKLEYGETVVSTDANDSSINGLAYKTDLTIGDLKMRNITVESSALDIFNIRCDYKFDGIIGANVLKQGYYYFDAATRKLIITNEKDKLPLDKLQNTVGLKRKMGRPYIYIKGNRGAWLLFDSGYANGSIMTTKNSKLIERSTKPIKEKYFPIGGMASEQIRLGSFHNQKIKLGNLTSIMPIVKYDSGDNNLVGNQLIQNNDVIIDVLQKKFYITPFQKPTVSDSIANINFRFKDNVIVVGALTKNSAIQKMGININDTIVSINNNSMEGIKTECDFDLFKTDLSIKKQIEIEIKKNKKIEKYIISKKMYYE